jgi:hypothetical protein
MKSRIRALLEIVGTATIWGSVFHLVTWFWQTVVGWRAW